MRLAHVAVWTRDLDAAARFWRDHFDAEIGERYRSVNRPGFQSIFVRLADGPAIELMSGPWVAPAPADEELDGWAHVAVSVGSEERVRALALRLRGEGLLISGPRRTGDGYYEAVVRSPDGALVEITAS